MQFPNRVRVKCNYVKTLGQGGFGNVYLYQEIAHPNRKFAVKIEKKPVGRGQSLHSNETYYLRKLQQGPHIPKYYNDSFHGDLQMFQMEYLDMSLEEYLA